MPGYNNWIKTNIKAGTNIKELPFEIEFSVPPEVETDFVQASNNTANLIANRFDNLYISLSGGMDSEYVATVFMRNKIPFRPVILKTRDNVSDVWYAEHFCHKNKLDPIILNYVDDNNRLLRKMFDYALQTSINVTVSFFPHVIAGYIESQGGSLITGYGEPTSHNNDYSVITSDYLEIEEHDYYLDASFGDRHPGGFLSYTPDIFFSFLTNIPQGLNTQVAKEILYQIPGRSKIYSDLIIPDFVPKKFSEFKDPSLRCIRTSRISLLDRIQTESTIKLSCV